MVLETASEEAAEPGSMAPAVQGALSVAAEAQPGRPLQRSPLCSKRLRILFPAPQHPAPHRSDLWLQLLACRVGQLKMRHFCAVLLSTKTYAGICDAIVTRKQLYD